MFLLEFMLGDEIMSENYQVGEFYNAKTFKESGFNFPDGKYKLKIIREGFPEDPVNSEDELVIAEDSGLKD
jgi:hypothetical protein